jgi:recombination protein RecT
VATTSDARKALAKKDEPGGTLITMINSMRPEIARALPKNMDPDRMARIATTLLRQTPRLSEVVPASFLGALMTCSQLGLEPGPLGLAWIIPRQNKETRRWEAHFQLGYKGVIELARRSGKLAKITARTVYQTEFDRQDFTVLYDGADEIITHRPTLIGDRGTPVLYYAIAKLTSNETNWAPLTPAMVESRHRQRSSAPNSPAWKNDYESMAWKSCVVELRRWLPQSPELEQALAQDGRLRTDIAPEVLETPAPIDMDIIDSTVDEDWPETPQPPDAAAPEQATAPTVDGEAT